MMFSLENSSPGQPLLLHDEPIYYDGKIVGETTSGNYSFYYNKNLAFGYVYINPDFELSNEKLFEIEVAKKKYKLNVLEKPLHDYKNKFMND